MKAKAKTKATSRSKAKTKTKSKVKAQAKSKTTTKPSAKSDFAAAARKLEAILLKYQRGSLKSRPDPWIGGFCLIGPATEASKGREVWFGAVGERKNYVSYHLMPVYAFPDLLNKVSPELKKRMQGKSCFNFKEVDDKLFAELARLTEEGYQRFKEEKLLR
jgi:hypothetical protein